MADSGFAGSSDYLSVEIGSRLIHVRAVVEPVWPHCYFLVEVHRPARGPSAYWLAYEVSQLPLEGHKVRNSLLWICPQNSEPLENLALTVALASAGPECCQLVWRCEAKLQQSL